MADPGFIVETPRLGLRRFTPADVPAVAAIFEDDAARVFYPDMHRLDRAEEWVRRNIDRYDVDRIGLWAVIEKATGDVAGDCGLMYQPLGDGVEVEVGYHVRSACRGRGYAREAAAACMDWGFGQQGISRIVSLVHPANTALHGVAARIHRHVRRGERHGILYFVYFTERPG